ncbi:DUF4097 family beta strand repeat-containing protein [Streptomyces canus]|uniref:DUF4097 family beta strand repeat-containing protein n=1 Tax=Streptomyces canus TaxID=58343 RepID=UPI00386A723A|nr:DUF4097 family beta strand repeat-containing protein [Streptomyces canus]WSZ60671.1 DUF4097 family beta strand repeat-containing protein [Streptomyces canus]
MPEWSVTEPRKLTFDEPVRELHVRIVNGTVNVVGTDEGSARLEVSQIEGPPLVVTQEAGTLTVAYEDLPWKGFLKWLDRKGWRRSAVVSLAVPADTRVEVGVVSAAAVVSGMRGPSVVKGVNGDTTLVGLSGPVRADTVSGNLEAQAVTGDLRFNSVSGDLTVVEGSGPSVRADSVSGSMIVDLDPEGPTDVRLTSVSGEIAIRLPQPADAEVEANTASGTISNAFDGLRVHGQWGAHKVTGRLGAGTGKLRATTVSGSIALLRRPPREDEEEPWETDPFVKDRGTGAGPADAADPVAGEAGASGDNSLSGPADDRDLTDDHDPTDEPTDDPTRAPADGTTDKKVL